MFGKTYELSLNKDYVSHWGLNEAVRELIQNALDSESPFVYEFYKEDDDSRSLVLTSEFTTLSPQTLLLGSTSKAGSEKAIGSFGEGYKIALLVLTRLGVYVRIDNGEKRWEPKFKFNNKFGQELLAIEETDCPFKNSGLKILIGGLSSDDIDGIIESCLQMQENIGQIKSTKFGEILLERPGMLYVGGLFICKTDLKYGYNIKPNFIKLERDRQTVSSFDLRWITKDMWFDTEEYEMVAEMIDEELPDIEYAEHSSPQLVKEACYRHFRKQHPDAVAAKSQEELNQLIEQGMERVVFVGSNMYSNVTGSNSYRSTVKVAVETIEERLKRWLSKNRSEMRTSSIVAFKELIEESKRWKYK